VYVSIFSTFFIPTFKLLLLKLHKDLESNSPLFDVTYYFLPYILRPFSRGTTQASSDGCIETSHRKKTDGSKDEAEDDRTQAKDTTSTTQSNYDDDSISCVKRDLLHPYYNANQIINNNFLTVALILTFGVVFPPLAICLAITSMVRLKFLRLTVGRLILNSIEANQLIYLRIVDEECNRVISEGVCMNCIFMIVGVCCVFYSLFLFDTLGDAVGFEMSYWVLIVMPILSVLMYGVYVAILYHQQSTQPSIAEVTAIEMSPMQSNPMIEVQAT